MPASEMRRGSATISRVLPEATAWRIRMPITGWHSVVLEPMTKMTGVRRSSSMLLVMAPLPKARARPATVEAWHRRAQWSTLLVPKPARTSFCMT